MAEVTGSIGNEAVELNNAATEATLRLLLQSSLTANKQTIDEIKRLAGKTFNFDTESLKEFNANIKTSKESSGALTKAFYGLGLGAGSLNQAFAQSKEEIKKFASDLTEGTAKVGDIFTPLTKLPGVFGLFFNGLQMASGYLDKTFESYQKVSSAGVNFGGSLTDLRKAATSSYLTLDQFGTLVKENSESLIRLGGGTNAGAKAFAQFSNEFMRSEAGTNALALGYTFEGANSAMLTYLSVMGVNNKEQLKTDQSLREGAARYLDELDRLAQITGKSREELNEKMKIEKLDADIQITAARIQNKEEREAFLANVRYMETMYGTAGKDMAVAVQQGRAVITKEGQTLSALAPGMQTAMQQLKETGARYGVGSKEYIDAQTKMSLAAQEGLGKVPTVVFSANDSIKSLATATGTVAREQMAGLTTREAIEKRNAEIEQDRQKRLKEESESKQWAETQKALKDLTIEINNELGPVIKSLIPVIKSFLEFTRDVLIPVIRFFGGAIEFTLGKVSKAAEGFNILIDSAIKPVINWFKELGENWLKSFGLALSILVPSIFGLSKILSAIKAPPAGPGTPPAGPGTPPAGPGTPPAGPEKKPLSKTAGKAATGLKVGGVLAAVTSGLSLMSDFKDISEKQISEEEKNKEKIEATGEAIGTTAGGAIGTAVGATLGSVVPVFGTALGGVLGGMAGSYLGSMLGRAGGERASEVATGSKSALALSEENRKLQKKSVTDQLASGTRPMAAGGIVSAPTLALVAEQSSPEAVIPLESAKLEAFLNPVFEKLKPQGTNALNFGNESTTQALMALQKIALPPMSRESQDYNARFSAPLPTKIPLDNESGSGLMSKLSSFINDLPKTVADKVDTVSKTATSYAQAPGNTIKSMENLQSELQTLNKQTTEMIRYLRETADNSRRNIDAINSLNGDLFRF